MALNLPLIHHLSASAPVARALRAQRLIASDPDAAALALDGALCELLHIAAGADSRENHAPDALLHALDARQPDLARRFRLALRAPHVEARLAHLWSFVEYLNAAALACDAPVHT